MLHLHPDRQRVAYILKRYPRFSETFIVNEILSHEAAGLEIDIISLRAPVDTHFQDRIALVKAGVTYFPDRSVRTSEFWNTVHAVARCFPVVWRVLADAGTEDVVDVYQALLLAAHVSERGIGHLHAHFASSATSVARLAAHITGLPFSFTAHAKDIFHESVEPDDLGRKLRDAVHVVTVSDFNVGYLTERFGADALRVERIYNGLQLDRFPYHQPDDRPPIIVGVGRLVEKKGFELLIDACAILAARNVEFSCRIVGTGDRESALRDRIEHHGIGNLISLLGPRPQSEVIEIVQQASAFAAPCVTGYDGNRDGLPTVLIEAMALGTPCVSTDVTGIPEILHDEQTGLMVNQNDAVGLANALERLLRDSHLRVRLAAQARQVIEREFDIDRNTTRLRSVFHARSRHESVGV